MNICRNDWLGDHRSNFRLQLNALMSTLPRPLPHTRRVPCAERARLMGESEELRRCADAGRTGGRPIERTTVFINPITLTTLFCCACRRAQTAGIFKRLTRVAIDAYIAIFFNEECTHTGLPSRFPRIFRVSEGTDLIISPKLLWSPSPSLPPRGSTSRSAAAPPSAETVDSSVWIAAARKRQGQGDHRVRSRPRRRRCYLGHGSQNK